MKSYMNVYIDAVDDEDETPLMWAAEIGNSEAAIILLENGANIHHTNKKGMTALHCAAVNGNFDIVQLLLNRRADKTARNNDSKTPLDVAEETMRERNENIEAFKKIINLLKL